MGGTFPFRIGDCFNVNQDIRVFSYLWYIYTALCLGNALDEKMAMRDLHSALKTDVIGQHQAGGVSYVLVRLQHSKTEISHSLHASSMSFSTSGLQRPGMLLGLGFELSNCSFIPGGKCFAREVADGFDLPTFAEAFTRCFNALNEADRHFQQCGIYVVRGEGPRFIGKTASSDGHTSPKVQHLKDSEDEVFRYILTWIDGGRSKGWTIHYRPQHPPLSPDLESAFTFLEGFSSFPQCLEFGFEQCYWRFLTFEERPETFERSNSGFAHKAFDAHASHFAPGLKKLLEAHAEIMPYGMNVLPSSKRVVQKTTIQEPRPPQVQKTRESAYKYDVALSFAGSERVLAEKLATILQKKEIKVFYDGFYAEHLCGKDLAVEFDRIYQIESRYCVMFISREYADRLWTIHERRSALARLLKERGKEYILPIKVEDINLDGLAPTIGYLALADYPIEAIAEILFQKLKAVS
ncbi:MAG TPA: hypothetical protein DCZ05_06835 [Deltaproteobacteria bacterium]|nr:hypothetical protein [Deltaproteobacteria bacterium]